MSKKAKATEAAQEAAPAVDQTPEAPEWQIGRAHV